MDESPTTHPANQRTVMRFAKGSRVTADWKVTNVGKQPLTDVLVHFYVVRIERPGQAPPPLEPKEVVIESALTMDFPVNGSTSAAVQFLPDKAGTYLVRIESPGTDQTRGQDHFAALDIVVK